MLIDLEEAENELRHAIVVECRQDVQATLRQRTDFCNMLTSMEDFLIKGVTTAVLNDAGTVPFLRDVLHRAVRNGVRRSLHSLSSHTGSGSNQDCLFGASWISFETSAGVTR